MGAIRFDVRALATASCNSPNCRFTRLRVRSGTNEDQARRLLAKAEETCLVVNSRKVHPPLETIVEFEGS